MKNQSNPVEIKLNGKTEALEHAAVCVRACACVDGMESCDWVYLASGLRCSLLSNMPSRLSSVLKCFLVAVVTVLMTAPSKSEGEEELRLLEMK